MTSSFSPIWRLVSEIPFGHVATYGQIAAQMGNPRAARFVVWALHHAPADLPCHRVVKKDGQLSSAFQPFGVKTHQMLLELEGISFREDGKVDLQIYQWHYPADKN